MIDLSEARKDQENIQRLAKDAGCCGPDSVTSPGASFLRLVAGDVIERVEYMIEQDADLESVDWEDEAHEAADSCVPIYTYEMWKTFVDLCAWQEDINETFPIADIDGMNDMAQIALFIIGERLARSVLEKLELIT